MTTVTYTASNSWTCPAGVSVVDCQCWGEGGNGAAGVNSTRSGGGGGGGAYAENTSVPVTPGNAYSFTIGTGGSSTDTTFAGDSSTTVTAAHGLNASGASGGTGGAAGSAPIAFAGGKGGNGVTSGSAQSGGGGGGSGGSAGAGGGGGNGNSSLPGTAGAAGAGSPGGALGGAGSSPGFSNQQNGSTPGGGGGGGRESTFGGSGAGAPGQITLTYTASGTTWSGAAALAGTGTITAAWAYESAAALAGTGTITATGEVSSITGAALTGTGTMTPAGALTFAPAAALGGAGTLAGASAGFGSATLTGTGTLTAVQSGESAAALTGTGTASGGNFTFGYTAPLAGAGTVTVARVLGVVTAAAARGPVTVSYAWPGSSQVAVSAPGSSRLYWLGTLGQVTALTYSFACPGGADKMTATVMVPATYRTQMFNPGWTVQVFRGGHVVWNGKLDEPAPTAQGWNLTATGTGNLGQNFVAVYTSTWPSGQPDQSINGAISRGLPWTNPGVGTPAGAWYGQAVDSGAQTISDLLKLICTRGGLTWYVNSQPGGTTGNDLSVFTLPATVNRLLVATTPVARTLGGDINTIYIRYEVTADNETTGAAATYALTSVQNAASVAMHDEMETYIDLSDAGVMTAGQAQQVGNYVLDIYQRASFAGPFTARYGDLLNAGGSPVDPGTDQAGNVVRMVLTDYGMGGEVVPGPIEWIVGAYSWDDIAETATITPYQTLNESISGLLSLESTILAPIQASS